MSRIIFFFSFFSLCLNTYAQTSFKAKLSSDKVAVGDTFEVTYIVSQNGGLGSFFNDNEIVFPAFKDFIEVGSYQSSSVNIINNQSRSETSYVKTFQAKKVGEFVIPKAKLVGKKNIFSNSLNISVVASTNNNLNLGNQSAQNQNQPSTNTDTQKTFLKWVVSNKSPYINEGVKLGLRIYSKDIEAINEVQAINPPKFQNLTTHLINNQQQQLQLEVETINGEEFGYVTLQEWIVFPQTSEKITIASAQVETAVYSNFFDNNLLTLSSEPISLTPKNLPNNAPSGFNGAVGQFKINTFLERNKLKKGETSAYEIEIVGNGNLDFLKVPEPSLNDSLEIFSPKERQNFTATSEGLKGKVVSSFLLVPQFQGKIIIPVVEFTFFDPTEGVYKTIISEKNNLVVKGEKFIQNFNKTANNDKSDFNFLDKINQNLVLAIVLFLLLIYAIYKFYFIKKNTKPTQELKEQIKVEEVVKVEEFNSKDKLAELQQLALDNKQNEFYEKQETFLNDWIEFKTNIPKYKISDQLVYAFFIKTGQKESEIKELQDIIHTSKQVKYASKFHKLNVNLLEEYNKMNSLIKKF